MLHLQHQFLHPFEHRIPFGSAFRPLAPSAFAPPQKRLKLENDTNTSQSTTPGIVVTTPTSNSTNISVTGGIAALTGMSNIFQGATAPPPTTPGAQSDHLGTAASPANSTTRSSPATAPPSTIRGPSPDDEDREASATPCSEITERSTPEEGRPFRRKKKYQADPTCCPACGITVRPQELEQHFLQELDRLFKVSSNSGRPRPRSTLPPDHHPQHNQLHHTPSAADGTPLGRWETYKRIKANRQARIRIKNRKRKADEPICPVCNERLSGTPEELNQHVERCLHKHNGNPNHSNLDDEEVDVEGDAETFEEYEWAGQRRVRATSMLVGGFSAVGLATSSSTNRGTDGNANNEDDDVDLVVDGDESAQFGPSQYTEVDCVAPRLDTPKEQKEREALREAVMSPNPNLQTSNTNNNNNINNNGTSNISQLEVKSEPGQSPVNNEQDINNDIKGDSNDIKNAPLLEALRGRIRELEAEIKGQSLKCLICMEQYKKPVTSVCCWHVHCEQCWLHTLGAKKLCPQCNMITSPSDLRRIYM